MDNLELITECELRTMHDAMLDDCLPMVEIGSLKYTPSDVLQSVDPIAYRMSMNEYVDSLIEDGVLVEGDQGEYYRA